MANVFKDIGAIWTRLFDHRPFLNGEIKYFVREFEENRSDREVEGLLYTLETLTEIKDQIGRFKLAGDSFFPALAKKISVAQEKSDLILSREKEFRKDTTLESRRALRKAEWENFIDDISLKCAKVDALFLEKENDLRSFYEHLEEKLQISPAHSQNK